MKKISILGGGRIGRLIAHDLKDYADVTVYDGNTAVVKEVRDTLGVATAFAQLDSEFGIHLVSGVDIVINALPGVMGYRTLERLITKGVPFIVDISFMPENVMKLDKLAWQHNSTVIVDAGVAPGLCNLMLGKEIENLDIVTSYLCEVGGLPANPGATLWDYKASFSPTDVIEEYTRPVKIVRHGDVVDVDPLSGLRDFDELGIRGKLVSFNTDGLRTLIDTTHIPWMTEKTIRTEKHYELIRIMRDSGLFDSDIRPAIEEKLFPHWEYGEFEADFTIMRVKVEGVRNGTHTFATYTLYDENDDRFSSMARTTGYTATACVRLCDKDIKAGIHPLETIAKNHSDAILSHLEDRDVHIDIFRGYDYD